MYKNVKRTDNTRSLFVDPILAAAFVKYNEDQREQKITDLSINAYGTANLQTGEWIGLLSLVCVKPKNATREQIISLIKEVCSNMTFLLD